MKKTLLSLAVLTSFAGLAQNQEVVVIKQSDYVRSPRSVRKHVDRNVENYNAFKFDPLRMAIGEINFSWETRVYEKTTLEFELGPTISNLGGNRNIFFDQMGNSYETNPGMGVLVSAAVRYYPLEGYNAMNKLYVSPRFKYRRYNESYTAPEGIAIDGEKGYSNEAIFSFNVGYQQWLSENFAFDYYVGIGIGSYMGSSMQLTSVYNNDTGVYDYDWKRQTENSARVVGVIGMKVTIGN